MGTTVLHSAAGYNFNKGHKDIVKLLLDNGADPNKKDRRGETPLSYIASTFDYDEDKDMVMLFLDHGAYLSANDIDNIRKIIKYQWKVDELMDTMIFINSGEFLRETSET